MFCKKQQWFKNEWNETLEMELSLLRGREILGDKFCQEIQKLFVDGPFISCFT